MTLPTANGGDRSDTATDGRRFLTPPAPVLRLQFVGGVAEPDQATLYPADAADIDRMETWLTIDAGVVRELSNCR
ncbi:hypothetical protein SY89_00103 [Halolamina pelagica]|uniref:DUF7511 domain-containing protein n=1 Tax=Halolamina pelagica TaxID=699431 RepID=A0A0P7H7M2_9EURY|nr:hypothetical protein [Halolamina pelagica]KPN29390.1 hypothetical protein SY89_00103 [Halolamina pelagica]